MVLPLNALLVVRVAVNERIAVVTGTGGEIVNVVPETATTCVLSARYVPVTLIQGAMPVASVTMIWVKLACNVPVALRFVDAVAF